MGQIDAVELGMKLVEIGIELDELDATVKARTNDARQRIAEIKKMIEESAKSANPLEQEGLI